MRILIVSAILVMSLSACSPQAPEAPVPAGPSADVAATAPAPTTAFKGDQGMMTGKAGSVPTCSAPAEISVAWDVSGKASTESVKLYVGDGTNAKLFASGGAQGTGKTGPWVVPGGVFVLRNGQDESELDRMAIPGPACP